MRWRNNKEYKKIQKERKRLQKIAKNCTTFDNILNNVTQL